VGVSAELLRPHDEAFAEAGFQVQSATSADQAIGLMQRGHYDVLVVGASVEEGERNRIAAKFKSRNEDGRIIFLYRRSIRNAEAADAVLSAFNKPADLARVICEQVGKQGAAE
jgi:DNA-binding response OmpR family regulator